MQQAAKKGKKIVSETSMDEVLNSVYEATAGYPLIIAKVDLSESGGQRQLWDIIRSRMQEPGACVIASENEGKALLMAAGTLEAVEKGFDAGALIKAMGPAVGGGGGGKPQMAQAGGKNPAGIPDALEIARNMLL
jgi:alanyl-tRNA synthetase